MIHSTVGEQKTPEPQTEYPKLMHYYSDTDFVVLMISVNEGVVVRSIKKHEVGDYCKSWNMDNFQDYTGTITLSNVRP